MKTTNNYQLNQYEKTDQIRMEAFNSDNRKIDQALAAAVPQGTILLWSGAVSAIPAGWHLCDGSDGTPDLRGRFVVGAGGDYAVGAKGGTATETLLWSQETSGTIYEGNYGYSTATHDNRPPYYALCFIMKA